MRDLPSEYRIHEFMYSVLFTVSFSCCCCVLYFIFVYLYSLSISISPRYQLNRVIGKLEFVKDSAASVAPSMTTDKDSKKNHSKTPPIAPAKTAYKFFCDAQTNKKENMQQVWKECSPEIRAKYQSLAKADKERYNMEIHTYQEEQRALEMYYEKKKQEQAMAFYEAHLEAQAALEQVQQQQQDDGKKKKKKSIKDPEAPKRCTSSYMFFAQDKRAEVVAKFPDAKVTEISKILGESKFVYEGLKLVLICSFLFADMIFIHLL